MLNIDLEFAVSQHYFLAASAGLTAAARTPRFAAFNKRLNPKLSLLKRVMTIA
jgi:hypothetical protein